MMSMMSYVAAFLVGVLVGYWTLRLAFWLVENELEKIIASGEADRGPRSEPVPPEDDSDFR